MPMQPIRTEMGILLRRNGNLVGEVLTREVGADRIEHMFESMSPHFANDAAFDHDWTDNLDNLDNFHNFDNFHNLDNLDHPCATFDGAWTDSDVLEQAITSVPGASLLMNLMHVDPAALSADEAVTYAQQADRLAAFVAGFQARARAEASARLVATGEEHADPRGRGSSFVTSQMLASAELAVALRMSPRTMDAQLQLAAYLDGPMVALREAMLAGELSAGHAAAIVRELTRLSSSADDTRAHEFEALCTRVLAVVVPYAATHTPGQCARRARALILAVDPAGAAERRRGAAEREHGVWLTPTEPGTCELVAVLPIEHGRAVLGAVTALADSEHFQTGEACITAGQRRAAALATLVLGDPGSIATVGGPVAEAKVNATVSVIVPLATCLGSGSQGGTIAGVPADSSSILDLIAEADSGSTIRRLVVDGAGCVVDAGRRRYAVTDLQRQVISLRDGTCRFPGCVRLAHRCEIDHATPWDTGGETDLDNLGALCKHHHQLKTFGGWRITRSSRAGTCTWRSPLGRIYEHQPPELIPPELIPPVLTSVKLTSVEVAPTSSDPPPF